MSKIIEERISQIQHDQNPYFVAELTSGYVVLGDHQRFVGYTLFLSKTNASELHELQDEDRLVFLEEMALVAECVWNAFKPDKLNYELLGNGDPHLHWHIFPRRSTDGVKGPVWWLPYEEMKIVLPATEMDQLKLKLKNAISENKAMATHLVRLSD